VGTASTSGLMNTSTNTVTGYVVVLLLFLGVSATYAVFMLGGVNSMCAVCCSPFSSVAAAKKSNAAALGNLQSLGGLSNV
jgi:hypothetical protein